MKTKNKKIQKVIKIDKECQREEEIDKQAGKSVQGMREKVKNKNIVIGSNGERRKKKMIYIHRNKNKWAV